MKKYFKIFILLCCSTIILAQAPASFNYQGVARDAQNLILKNQSISLKLSILQGASNGNLLFEEEHQLTTTALGVFSLQVGNGQINTGNIANIDWTNGSHWLQVEMDPLGGSSYITMGASQLVSVPYALHAESVTNSDDADADPVNEIQTLGFDVATNVLSLTNGGQVDLSGLDNDGGGSGTDTDDQILSVNGTILSIEDGNSVDLAVIQDGVTDADADSTNELQMIQKSGNVVTLSNNGGSFTDEVTDADANPQNELQDLNFSNGMLSLSQSNVQIPINNNGSSPWKEVPQTDIIEYVKTDPLAIISDGTKKLLLSKDNMTFLDSSDFVTNLYNGNLVYSSQNFISDDIVLLNEAMRLDHDSISFRNYDINSNEIIESSFDKFNVKLKYIGGNDNWKSELHPQSLDFEFNGNSFGSYDAYGLQIFTDTTFDMSKDWEIRLKPENGLYMGANFGNGKVDASLTTNYGFYLGNGPGFGSLNRTDTYLNKDSLTFDYMVQNGLLSGYSTYSRDQLTLKNQAGALSNTSCMSPENICLNTSIGGNENTMNLVSENIEFINPNFGYSRTYLGLDSLQISSAPGLLYPDITTLKAHELKFESLDDRGHYNSRGFSIKYALSNSDIFDRISMYPDNFTMFNEAKWKTTYMGTNSNSLHGELSLFGNSNIPHTEITSDINGPVFQMNHNGNLRVGFWGFEDFGIINTQGKNGFQNTYVGTPYLHNDPNKGGLGVMDNFGILQAGIEVDPNGVGNVHSTGSINVYDQNGATNFRSSANILYDGNSNSGFAAVYDDAGVDKAGMVVTSSNGGFLYSDAVYIGEKPSNNALFPLKVVQRGVYGLNLARADQGTNWEFYVDNLKRLSLWNDGTQKGYFDPVSGNYMTFSDRRIKRDIEPINDVLASVKQLNPTEYAYRDNNPENKKSIGFIAQEVQRIFPELVESTSGERGEERLSIDYAGFNIIAIKAIQEQQKIIENQATEIQKMKEQLNRIEALLDQK